MHTRAALRRSPATAVTVLVGAVLSLAGCAEPDSPTEPAPEPAPAETSGDEPDDRDELLAQLDVLRARLGEIQDALTAVNEANSLEEVQAGTDRALASLVVAPDAGSVDAPQDAAALLPSETFERSASASAPDLLNATLTLAGNVGGELGTDVTALLHDPIAGDLGAWQRDAAGMVALAQDVATSSTDLPTLETAIRELEGEGTRALAWTFVAAETDDLELARTAAERGLAHVQIMVLAIDDVGGAA